VLIRRAYTASLEERAAQLEAARVADARTAVSEERGRIARELHDVVAHHVSVMTVQATAAQRMLERDPALAREAMAAVESTGRAALGEMRSIVGVLRESAGERSDALAPQPRLADLDCLLVSLREAGLRVALVRSGDLTDLPAGIDLALYRIVQEALTNTLRHAGPTSAEVTLVRSTHAVQVRVVDSGRGAAAALNGSGCAGHGLIGMRERVALYGGDLTAGPRSGGGYIVEASIPLVPARRVAPEARPAEHPPAVPSHAETRGEPARPVLPGRPGVPA
jgi:signal transduction histidine kinase